MGVVALANITAHNISWQVRPLLYLLPTAGRTNGAWWRIEVRALWKGKLCAGVLGFFLAALLVQILSIGWYHLRVICELRLPLFGSLALRGPRWEESTKRNPR